MKVQMNSWVEVTIPTHLLELQAVREAMDHSIATVGGATLTTGRGYYVRKDDGSVDCEEVTVVRWDYDAYSPQYSDVLVSIAGVTSALLASGEESVLCRRHSRRRNPAYWSGLIFA